MELLDAFVNIILQTPDFMKNILALLLIAGLTWACNNEKRPTAETGDAAAMPDAAAVAGTDTYTIDATASTLLWEGYEGLSLGQSAHNGSLRLASGTVNAQGNLPVAGKFVIDITSLKVEDIPAGDTGNAKLTRHLLNADFFDVAKYPQAVFEITQSQVITADSINITGNLTLRGTTKSVTFPAKTSTANGVFSAVTPKFYINRKDWGMFYRSEDSLGDDLIRPEMGIMLAIVAKK